jgi:hypothetical protein
MTRESGVVRIESQDQHPILDQVATKVIQKYQNSTCQQLWVERAQKPPPTPAEVKAVQLLRDNPQMRARFLNKVAAPIANTVTETNHLRLSLSWFETSRYLFAFAEQ